MDDIERENSKNVQKNHKARTRMVAVRMMRVPDMSAEETTSL